MAIENVQEEYLMFQRERESNARAYSRHFPFILQKAQGVVVTDVAGKQYYDCLAGAGTLVL